MGEIQNMRRWLVFLVAIIMTLSVFLGGCSGGQIDRGQELEQAMSICESKWSQSFPDGKASFEQIADFIADWGSNAGLEVTKKSKHYLVLTNAATSGQKKTPSVTFCVSVDPSKLRDCVPMVSLGMVSALGPLSHGRLRLIVTETAEDSYPGADAVKSKYLKSDHTVYLYKGSSGRVYTAGPMSEDCVLSCKAARTNTSFDNAYEISVSIPAGADPYTFEKAESMPNPVNVLGDLLSSAKSAGRLFEIAQFTAESNGDYLPAHAKAVVVMDDNNVEAFQKRFETSYKALEKTFDGLELETDEDGNPLETFSYTMVPTELPKKVLKQAAGERIISLMYTLQTGIYLSDEVDGSILAASYIRSVSTEDGRFTLNLDQRSRDEESMQTMSAEYLATCELCDVNYKEGEPHRLWSCEDDSSLAAWFTAAVNKEGDDTTYIHNSECDRLYAKRDGLDMISYRIDKDHRDKALSNMLNYCTSLAEQN